MEKEKWYQQKRFYIPIAILAGLLGFGAGLATLLGVEVDDELNPDYYRFSLRESPLWCYAPPF